MLQKIKTQIETKVNNLLSSNSIQDIVRCNVDILHSIYNPCIKVAFYSKSFDKPKESASQAKKDAYNASVAKLEGAKGKVQGVIFNLTSFNKDVFNLTNARGNGLTLNSIEPLTDIGYGGFAVNLEPKGLTKSLYNELKTK